MQWTPIETQQSIIIAKAQGLRTKDIARKYGVSRATVYRIIEKLRKTNPEAGNRLSGGRPDLAELKKSLLVDSHVAIDRSVKDEGEVHKASSTGLAYLKGVGEHSSGERSVDMDVNVLVANVPAGFDELMARHGMGEDTTERQASNSTDDSSETE
jgi:transposase-like protein